MRVVRVAALACALAPAWSGCSGQAAMQLPGETQMVSTQMEVKRMDAAWTLAFLLENASTRDVQVTFMEPFVGFSVEAVGPSGERLEVVQPGLNLPVRPARHTVSPGATFRLGTPIQIRFDTTVPPSGGNDPMMWSIRSQPVAVKLRATLRLGGIDPQLVEGHLDL